LIFTSLAYLFFLTLTAVAYYLLPGRFRWVWLLIASVGYYLSFIPIFLPLMASIVAINYLMAKWLGKASPQNSRNRLIAIVGVNVLILAFFKYFNFFFPLPSLLIEDRPGIHRATRATDPATM
jgi:D-alanyl-lipoteichoic acid acyltransferase DltB (MBOAT superfamily)